MRAGATKMTWIEWIDRVEAIIGSDLDDADVAPNERSPLDKAYDAYESGVSPVAYLGQSVFKAQAAPISSK